MGLTPGEWHTVVCALGHSHEVYIQKKTDECAVCCAAMVINRLAEGHPKPDLSELRQSSQKYSGGYHPSEIDAGATRGDPRSLNARIDARDLAKQGFESQPHGNVSPQIRAKQNLLANSYAGAGTYAIENLPQLLAADRWKITATSVNARSDTALRSSLKQTSSSHPYVLQVAWDNGGGHAVLLEKHKTNLLGKDQFCICDPGFGVVVATFAPDNNFQYKPGISKLPYTVEGSVGHLYFNYLRC